MELYHNRNMLNRRNSPSASYWNRPPVLATLFEGASQQVQPDLLSLVSKPQPVTKTSKPASVVVVASKELVVCLE